MKTPAFPALMKFVYDMPRLTLPLWFEFVYQQSFLPRKNDAKGHEPTLSA